MRVFACILFLLFIHQSSFAQEDIDAGFKQVRAKAETKDYNGALGILSTLEQKYPGNEDILVYQGRVYSWKRDFAKAKKILRPLADRENPNIEALETLIMHNYGLTTMRPALPIATNTWH